MHWNRQKRLSTLRTLLNQRILILDGAMGTMVQSKNLVEGDYHGLEFKNHHQSLKGNFDILNITQPNIIKNIHFS